MPPPPTHPVSSLAIPCPHRPKPTSSQPSLSSPSQPSLPPLAVHSPPSRCLLSSTSSPCDPSSLKRLLLRFLSAPFFCPLCRPRLAPSHWLRPHHFFLDVSPAVFCSHHPITPSHHQGLPHLLPATTSLLSPKLLCSIMSWAFSPRLPSYTSTQSAVITFSPIACFSPIPRASGQKSGHHF